MFKAKAVLKTTHSTALRAGFLRQPFRFAHRLKSQPLLKQNTVTAPFLTTDYTDPRPRMREGDIPARGQVSQIVQTGNFFVEFEKKQRYNFCCGEVQSPAIFKCSLFTPNRQQVSKSLI